MVLLILMLMAAGVLVLAGAGAAGLRARHRFALHEGAFRCRVRVRGCQRCARPGRWRGRWRRLPMWAFWMHDVLLIHSGLFSPRLIVLAVRSPDGALQPVPAYAVRGFGTAPVLLGLACEDGGVVDVIAASADRTRLTGPFLAAAIPGLPKAPSEWRRRAR